MDAVVQVESHQRGVEWQNPLPCPARHASFDAVQDTVGFLGCKCTLLSHAQFFIHQYRKVLLDRAALNLFIPQSVLILGTALGLVEFHQVHMRLQACPGPSGWHPFPQVHQLHHSALCHPRFTKGALSPTVYVADEDIKLYRSQKGPMSNMSYLFPFGKPNLLVQKLRFSYPHIVPHCHQRWSTISYHILMNGRYNTILLVGLCHFRVADGSHERQPKARQMTHICRKLSWALRVNNGAGSQISRHQCLTLQTAESLLCVLFFPPAYLTRIYQIPHRMSSEH